MSTGSAAGAVTAGQVANNEVLNNSLSVPDRKKLSAAADQCINNPSSSQYFVAKELLKKNYSDSLANAKKWHTQSVDLKAMTAQYFSSKNASVKFIEQFENTYTAGVSGTLIGVWGGTVSAGLYLNLGFGKSPFYFGVYGSSGYGLDPSAGLSVGYVNGNSSNLRGASTNINMGFSIDSIEIGGLASMSGGKFQAVHTTWKSKEFLVLSGQPLLLLKPLHVHLALAI